ncbi:MAG: outer membrane beta-barrel protein [Chitinophagaceae bacterium]
MSGGLSNLYINVKFNKNLSLDLSNTYVYKRRSYVIEMANYYQMDAILQQKIAHGKAAFRFYWNDVFNTDRDKNYGNYQLFNMAFCQKRITQNFRFMFVYNFSNNQKIKDKKVESNSDIRNSFDRENTHLANGNYQRCAADTTST